MENFKPLFKEKEDPNYKCRYFPDQKGYYPPKNQQYYYEDGRWIKCSEDVIMTLWGKWIVSENPHKYLDEDGFTVFGNTHTQYGWQ